MELLLQVIFSLIITGVARASLLLISFVELTYLVRVDLTYVKLSTCSNFCMLNHDIACCMLPGAVNKDLAFLCASFHTISSCCFLQCGSKILEFYCATSQKINISSKILIVEHSPQMEMQV